MLHTCCCIGWVLRQSRSRGGLTGCAPRCAAQGGRPLDDRINVVRQLCDELIEQLVQREELGAFDVPMSLFRLAVEVKRVGQMLVEQCRRFSRVTPR